MLALWLVLLFPFLMMAVYTALFVGARMLGGVRGMARMGVLAPHLFPLILLIPFAAICYDSPAKQALHSAWQLRLTPPWCLWMVIGVVTGTLLFQGESAFNQWRARRAERLAEAQAETALKGHERHSNTSGVAGLQFSPWLAPFQSLLVVCLEESIWRVFLIGAIASQWELPQMLALLLSSALFALHHLYFGPATATYKGFSALIWGLLYIASGSAWVSMSAHLSSDLLAWRRLGQIARAQASTLLERQAQEAANQHPSHLPHSPAPTQDASKSYVQ